MKPFAFVVALLLLTPSLGQAQAVTVSPIVAKISVSLDYLGGGFDDLFTYPSQRSLRSGKAFDGDGIAAMAQARVSGKVSAGYRFERVGLRHSQFVTDSVLTNGGSQHLREPDSSSPIGTVSYQEFFGAISLPKTAQSLILGFATTSFTQRWPGNALRTSFKGLVAGIQGDRKFGREFSVQYSGRVYPHLAQTSGYVGSPVPRSGTKGVGFELHAGIAWSLARHVALTGSYQFRRLGSDSLVTGPGGLSGETIAYHENQSIKGKYIVGTRFSF